MEFVTAFGRRETQVCLEYLDGFRHGLIKLMYFGYCESPPSSYQCTPVCICSHCPIANGLSNLSGGSVSPYRWFNAADPIQQQLVEPCGVVSMLTSTVSGCWSGSVDDSLNSGKHEAIRLNKSLTL